MECCAGCLRCSSRQRLRACRCGEGVYYKPQLTPMRACKKLLQCCRCGTLHQECSHSDATRLFVTSMFVLSLWHLVDSL